MPARAAVRNIPNLRWWVMGLIFLASVLNYLDRQTLSLLIPTIQKELRISDAGYAKIVNLFLIAYTLAYLFSGRLTDRLKTRWSMVLFVGWWSVANMLTGLARSGASLGLFRFCLGLGEAGNYTVAPKVAAEWFPPRERGIAVGMSTLGATIGATIAPVLVIRLATLASWRAAFMTTGALGLLWIVPWLWLYHAPDRHPRLTDKERRLLAEVAAAEMEKEASAPAEERAAEQPSEGRLWRAVLTRRDVWALMAARLLTDPVWYFYQFWLAKYLNSERGLPQKELGVTWVVYLAADVGSLLGGLLSGWQIQRGARPVAARLTVMLGCACLLPLSPLVASAPSLPACLGLAMLMVMAHMIWLINLSALVVDRIPQRIVGTAFGVIAAGSTLGGILMNAVVGRLATAHAYGLWFGVMALLHPLSWLMLRIANLHTMRPVPQAGS